MANEEIAKAFREIAALLELKGASPFQVRAYQKAADRLVEEDDLATLAREGRLTDLPGIGKALADKIGYFLATGTIPLLEGLREEVPPGMVELASLSGLGPSRVRLLRESLSIGSVEDLEEAMEEGRLQSVKGFGPKRVEEVRASIGLWKKNRGLRLHRIAWLEAKEIIARALESGAQKGAPAGRLARFHETVSVIPVVIGAEDGKGVLGALARLYGDGEHGPGSLRFTGRAGIVVSVRVVSPSRFGSTLLYQTGAVKHREALQAIAGRRGLEFDETGLHRGGDLIDLPDEEAAYEALGLPFIPPEIREGTNEIDVAQQGGLPRFIEASDIKGLLHVHSTWSDGKASIREMAEHARSLGLQYIGLADHSKTAAYAGGLSPERLRTQRGEVAKVNEQLAPFRVFHGIESDILRDGSLDYDDDLLASLDFVIASVHARFAMDRRAMTERLVAATRNRLTTMLGHPSGRLLLARDPYDFDSSKVWEAARESGTMVELNANERRLDIEWRQIPAVRQLGILISIGPDAHDRKALEEMELAIHIARKGWLTKEDVLNTRDVDQVAAALGQKSRRR